MSADRPKVRAVFDCMVFLQGAARRESAAGVCLLLVESDVIELYVSQEIMAEVNDRESELPREPGRWLRPRWRTSSASTSRFQCQAGSVARTSRHSRLRESSREMSATCMCRGPFPPSGRHSIKQAQQVGVNCRLAVDLLRTPWYSAKRFPMRLDTKPSGRRFRGVAPKPLNTLDSIVYGVFEQACAVACQASEILAPEAALARGTKQGHQQAF